jgi:sterol 3beta-glucosyltransferase
MTRTRLLLVAAGTLGDVQPIASIASQFAPDECTIATNPRHFPLFPEKATADLGFDPNDMFSSHSGQRLITGAPYDPRRLTAMRSLVTERISHVLSCLQPLFESHSALVVSGLPFGVNSFAGAFGIKPIRIFYNPAYPTAEIPTFYLNTSRSLGARLNRLSYSITEAIGHRLFDATIESTTTISFDRGRPLIFDYAWDNTPTIFGIPPIFATKEILQATHTYTVGFIRPPRRTPSTDFILALRKLEQARQPIIYCGFGSMRSQRTARLIEFISRACADLNVLVAIQAPKTHTPTARNIVPIPSGDHRDLFPHCAALIHHGGSGTTAASLDSGRPFLIVPQWADQFYWQQRSEHFGLSFPAPRPKDHANLKVWRNTILSVLDKQRSAERHPIRRDLAGRDGASSAVAVIRRELASA